MKGYLFLLGLGAILSAALSKPNAVEEYLALQQRVAEEVEKREMTLEQKDEMEAEEEAEREIMDAQDEEEAEKSEDSSLFTEKRAYKMGWMSPRQRKKLLQKSKKALALAKKRIRIYRDKLRWDSAMAKCGMDDVLHTLYSGTVNKTVNGKICKNWENSNKFGKYLGIGDHNYCRNPNNDPKGLWCMTGKKETGYCKDPDCPDLKEVVGKAGCTKSVRYYFGFMDKTKSGKTCAKWSWQRYKTNGKLYRESKENYARGMYQKSTPGCFPIDPCTREVTKWEDFSNPCT